MSSGSSMRLEIKRFAKAWGISSRSSIMRNRRIPHRGRRGGGSVQGRLSCRQRGQHIAPRTLAGQDHCAHFVLRDPCHLPHVPERAFNITASRRLVPVRGDIEHYCDQRSHLTEGAETTTAPLGKVHSFLRAKQPFDESIELLTADQRAS